MPTPNRGGVNLCPSGQLGIGDLVHRLVHFDRDSVHRPLLLYFDLKREAPLPNELLLVEKRHSCAEYLNVLTRYHPSGSLARTVAG